VLRHLRTYFAHERTRDFNAALRELCRFYQLPRPRVVWFERLGHSNGATFHGFCTEGGTLELIHPENWKRKRKYKTEAYWIKVVLHEFGHYVLWSHSGRVTIEHKADRFRDAILKGVA